MQLAQEKNQQTVVKMVQEMIVGLNDKGSVTPALIDQNIDSLLTIMPRCREGLDRVAVIEELIRRFSIWTGQDTVLTNNFDHKPWLSSERKKTWRYWQRYREWQELSLSDASAEALDRSTDKVLALLEDPEREGNWDRRGLVVGHVQSGKTGNYTGLICKAADAGYKIIIVLAGLHNNLRSQTQIRLDEGFLGYATKPSHDIFEPVGVGLIDPDPKIKPNYATNRSEKGDFNAKAADHMGISPEARPWLFVVKKNKTVLTRLLKWIHRHVTNTHDPVTGRKMVTHLPLLLIDDEADNASVDTGAQMFDEQGKPDADHDPKAINSLTRKLLLTFSRSAYVGYTATPFANIFIHERGETSDEGIDLFPSSFIITLGAPSNYIGPVRLFGLGRDEGRDGGLHLAKKVEDATNREGTTGWMPHRHKNGHLPRFNSKDRIPDSLAEAINSFIIACTVRHLRKKGRDHSSMLIHVTRFNSVQKAVFDQVDRYVTTLQQKTKRKIDCDQLYSDLESLWKSDFLPVNESLRGDHPDLEVSKLPAWQDVRKCLPNVLADIKIRMINGTAKDALDYEDHEGTGLKVIAIGGDKLARGLTLEGLCTSYFLRASRMYDTLMQMGRWFGYRTGYLDVCRLYTTLDLIEWFCHITDAAEELREEFDLMAESGGTPRDYGLKVQSHPVLMVTSRVKMRTARNLMLSFSGCLAETVALQNDAIKLQKNLDALNMLINLIGSPDETNPVRKRKNKKQKWEGYLWNEVPSDEIIEFLSSYETHPEAYKVNKKVLAQFIAEMNKVEELTSWTVALIGGGDGKNITLDSGLALRMLERTPNDANQQDRYSIGRLLSPRDESIDLDNGAWNAALQDTKKAWHADPARRKAKEEPDEPNGPAVRKVRGLGAEAVAAHPERGLLLLYVLDPERGLLPNGAPPVVAFGMSFPGSRAGKKVKYMVNNIEWEQEYGAAE
jgi:hypothetical protein